MILSCAHCGALNRVPAERLAAQPKCGVCKQSLLGDRPQDLDAASFSRFITKNELPVLVDFWASWCGPCKMMAPVFEQVAAQLKTQIRFAKVQTDSEQALAAQWNIRSIPTLVLFRNGREVARASGAMDARSLTQWITAQLAAS